MTERQPRRRAIDGADPGRLGDAAAATPIWRRHSPRRELLNWLGWLLLVLLFVVCWELMTQDQIWAFVWDAPRQGADLVARMLPPRWEYLNELWLPLWDTINIATLGTLGGVIMAVPVAFMAARNTTPSAAILRPIALFIIVASRSINSLIWALLLVAIIGPGLLAGIVAIALRSIGFIGKLLYEAIEETDASQIEAIEATGANRAQVLNYGIVPQIMPAFWGITVFRWDINIRESTILGLVGAGGIGLKLQASLNTLAWSQVSVILILILATVVLSEWVSARMRHAII
jgi:phosphonate transport system permease protein